MRTKMNAPKVEQVIGRVTYSKSINITGIKPFTVYGLETVTGETIKVSSSPVYLDREVDTKLELTMDGILSSGKFCRVTYLKCLKGKTTWRADDGEIGTHKSDSNAIGEVTPISSNAAQIAQVSSNADDILSSMKVSEEKRAELKVQLVTNLLLSGYGL